MRTFDIALGTSRRTKRWKNSSQPWDQIVTRLAIETRTPETVAEYKAMSRDRQSEIKDVGGFVGGYCVNGDRSNVKHRSLLTLDADYADLDIWTDVCELLGCTAALYSTHKHTPESPRLRLVIPMARDVDPEEYQAVGRRVAAILGIDKFDDTTYQAARLMYWPSCSYDGEYIFRQTDGELLDPDTILATYHDWHDISTWPVSSRVAELATRSAKQQQDPLQKPGLIGAFCRAYTIQEAIELFVPSYVPCDDEGRYTYAEGSTAAGVVIYDDKFSFSHHATDPASGQLCNAWDLVRLHKFGGYDAEIDPESTRPASRPSYKAMTQLATADPKVRAQLVGDRMAEAVEDYEPDVETVEDWHGLLKITEKGGIAQTIENVVLILEHDPKLSGHLALNEMDHNLEVVGDLPWRSGGGQWSDADDAGLRYYLETVYGVSGKDRIFDAVNVVAQRHTHHPVRDYLDACSWDGIPRVDTLLIDYLGAEDTPYTRAVTRKTLVAAVARIYRPGCKYDYMLTIRGRQGLGKSALIARLGGQWFSDSFTTLQGKDAYEQVLGVWLMEVGELAGMRKAEAETIKLYISKQVDRFRPAYGRRTQEFPRQCIFIGTTNEGQFLRDTTGNRRFWVVDTPNDPTRSVWEDLTPEAVALIWGEAVTMYQQGEELYLPRELEEVAREVQASYEEEDPRAGIIAAYLDRKLPEGWDDMDLYARRDWLASSAEGTRERTTVCSLEVWAEALGGSPDRPDRYQIKEIHGILSALPEWRRAPDNSKKVTRPYGRQKYYERVT